MGVVIFRGSMSSILYQLGLITLGHTTAAQRFRNDRYKTSSPYDALRAAARYAVKSMAEMSQSMQGFGKAVKAAADAATNLKSKIRNGRKQ